MRTFRVRLSLVSSLGTPFQADTLFGHICWAIRYLEGEGALTEFLDAYTDGKTPVILSDGMPAIGNRFYLPYPRLPVHPKDHHQLAERLGISPENRAQRRLFESTCKAVEKKPWVEAETLMRRASPISVLTILEDCLSLKICPGTMSERDGAQCSCADWQECPALDTGLGNSAKCHYIYPESFAVVTMHNVIDRITMASVNLYSREDLFPAHDFYFLISIDEQIFSQDRLAACLDYIARTGYGRDKSSGCGAIRELKVEEWSLPHVSDANGFLNLSSAYVPTPGKLPRGFYQVHVKRGKIAEDYVLSYSPWKRPILMIRAGAVFEGDPNAPYGSLLKNVHYQLDQVVQYGYAYPLGVKIDAEAL